MVTGEVFDWLKCGCINDGNGLLVLPHPQFVSLGDGRGNWQNGCYGLVVVLKPNYGEAVTTNNSHITRHHRVTEGNTTVSHGTAVRSTKNPF